MDTRASDRIADEQAALRRVAVLVAGGASPEEVFAAVTAEVRRLLGADLTALLRYEADREMTFVARWTATGEDRSGGTRVPLGGQNVSTRVFETGQPARMDDTSGFSGASGEIVRGLGVRSVVGVPVMVEGRLWGVMLVSNRSEEPFPADATARLAGLTELVGTAIANAQARVELRDYAEEQAALRRVATLVAGGTAPEAVFAAVAAEAGRLLSANLTTVTRYDPHGVLTTLGAWSSTGTVVPFTAGSASLGGRNISGMVLRTGQPARIDDYKQATGGAADLGREWGIRAAVGAPIRVEGRLWGVMAVASSREEPLPADAEARLAGFTELAGTAIANAEARAALAASRARMVAAADEARRRIERDLHDGAQQRLVTLALQLREAQATASPEAGDLVKRLDGVATGLESALAELREIARGIHPAILSEGGLRPALAALARSSAVPVDLRVEVAGRLPGPVEIAVYYVACEALANVAKHAGATAATVEAVADEGALRVRIRDDGRGGAAFGRGSGLVGLRDRVEALNGRITLHSPPGAGTVLEVHIPVARCKDA